MNEIKRRIIIILELAQSDFSAVNEIFRLYSGTTMYADIFSSVSEGIKFLQYMDTLTQKLNHIVSLNQALAEADTPEDFSDDDPAEFIFRLNYFQAVIAHGEFLSTTEKLKGLINELNNTYPLEKLVSFPRRGFFRNLKKEEANMHSLLLTLRSLYADCLVEENRKGVCPLLALAQVEKVYTMNSERLVLEWLREHPLDNINELMRIYSHSGFGQEEQQADFF